MRVDVISLGQASKQQEKDDDDGVFFLLLLSFLTDTVGRNGQMAS